ncbi:MAG: hypothetical protein BWZ02_03247 [Lentisphaerae bacterium ADurb.BinA184]|nr:MAG: hypothetical protein BWZ02_03247 [Lentisphaerae bacterium ADurb.BinA184]
MTVPEMVDSPGPPASAVKSTAGASGGTVTLRVGGV